jgi:hypothetical protein
MYFFSLIGQQFFTCYIGAWHAVVADSCSASRLLVEDSTPCQTAIVIISAVHVLAINFCQTKPDTQYY